MDPWWQRVITAATAEFADIHDIEQLTRVTVRLLMAGLLGGILGWEREHKHKAAGMRTHMLVALGACLFVLVPQMAGADDSSLSRVIQGLVAGIGFLGAGTILKEHAANAHQVKGLTTAAGLWMTAAIGVATGMGREATAVISTVLALIVLAVLPILERRIDHKAARHQDDFPDIT